MAPAAALRVAFLRNVLRKQESGAPLFAARVQLTVGRHASLPWTVVAVTAPVRCPS